MTNTPPATPRGAAAPNIGGDFTPPAQITYGTPDTPGAPVAVPAQGVPVVAVGVPVLPAPGPGAPVAGDLMADFDAADAEDAALNAAVVAALVAVMTNVNLDAPVVINNWEANFNLGDFDTEEDSDTEEDFPLANTADYETDSSQGETDDEFAENQDSNMEAIAEGQVLAAMGEPAEDVLLNAVLVAEAIGLAVLFIDVVGC